jgi:hypothetical protein
MRWRAVDIIITLDHALTDDPIVTAQILTPSGAIDVMATVSANDSGLVFGGLHIQGMESGRFGLGSLRRLADAIMEEMNYDEIRVEGAPRTTGANKGRRQVLRFKRRIFSDSP